MSLFQPSVKRADPTFYEKAKTTREWILELIDFYSLAADRFPVMLNSVGEYGILVEDVVEILVLAERHFGIVLPDDCIDPDDISELRVSDLVRIIETACGEKQ